PCANTRLSLVSEFACSSRNSSTLALCSLKVSPPPRRGSCPAAEAATVSGYSFAISAIKCPDHDPTSTSRRRGSHITSAPTRREYARAVSRALGRSLLHTRSTGPTSSDRTRATNSACSRPRSVRPESRCPCWRPSTFQSDSPCLTIVTNKPKLFLVEQLQTARPDPNVGGRRRVGQNRCGTPLLQATLQPR